MDNLKLTQIGNSLGLVLPDNVLTKLGLNAGESVYVANTPDGLLLSRYDPRTRQQLTAGRELMRDHGMTFRTLGTLSK